MADVIERIKSRAAKSGDGALYRLHPELRDRVHMFSMTANEQPAAPYSYKLAAADYERHTWVHKAIRVIDNNIAHLPLRVLDSNGDEREDHELTALFSTVNESQSPPTLWSQWVTDMMLGGESGLELVKGSRGGLLEVWPRQPSQITVVTDAERRRYYGVSEYKIRFDATDKGFTVPREEFVHFKFYNPLNPWRGLSPITAVRTGIVIDQLAQAWARAFFANSARPDYALVAPQGISPTERKDLEEKLAVKFGGGQGAHKPIVLEEGITDIKTFSYAPKDLEWLEQRKMSRDEIGGIFGVPDEIMGYGKDTYENFDKAMELLWTLTLVPLLGFRDWQLTKHFRMIGRLRPDERLTTDTREVKQLQEDLTEKLEQGKRFFEMGYTPDQINDRLGLGMDMSPVSDLPFAGRPVPGLLGGIDSTPARAIARQAMQQTVNKAAVPDYGTAEHEARMKEVEDRQEPHIVKMRKELKKQFQRQQIEVGRALRDGKSKGLGRGKHIEGDKLKLNVDELFNLSDEVKRWIDEFLDIVAGMFYAAGIAEFLRVGGEGEFDVNQGPVQDAIEEVLGEMARKVNDTTYNDLVDLFQEAEAEGESIPMMMERLSSYFEGRKSDASTERIARTTMTGADSKAGIEAYAQSGVVSEVAWLSALLPTTRQAHIDAHGQIRKLGESFDVGGEKLRYPGDPAGSAENIINCVCTPQPIVE